MKIKLDGNMMNSKEMAHRYIKWRFKMPDYYGNNLDALWDLLSTYSQPIEIELINKDRLIGHLGDYGKSLIQVFQDAQEENSKLSFTEKE